MCRFRCFEFFDDCFEVFNSIDVLVYCVIVFGGYVDSGFCELIRWFGVELWDVGM